MADPTLDALSDLLTDVPHVMFCVKDREGRYLAVNQAFADRAGRATPAEIVGLTAADLFPAELAESYARQDARLWDTGQPLRNELELILRPDGSVGWYVTSKTLFGSAGRGAAAGPTAIASVSVDLRAPAESAGVNARVAAAVAYARVRSTEAVSVADLAAAADLTVAQLERAIRRAIGLSAKQLILRLRLEEAILRLRTTDAPVSQIATDCGYYDQSAFTRQFRRVVGMGPGAYRAALTRRTA
ncbi:MAG: putative AraC family transcriptional regulator [Ilumatobacteraceae bacterium]|nr:putative AraC family transcriptional regulator [Ilumatobacteraceae bacterium]